MPAGLATAIPESALKNYLTVEQRIPNYTLQLMSEERRIHPGRSAVLLGQGPARFRIEDTDIGWLAFAQGAQFQSQCICWSRGQFDEHLWHVDQALFDQHQ